MSQQEDFERRSEVAKSKSAQDHTDDRASNNSDDEPMVYKSPRDYTTSARQQRDRLIASGADPNSVILLSELRNHVPRQEGDSPTDFAIRYSQTMNAMVRRGISILNDQCTADVVASEFGTADDRVFDLGPGSGATKGEFREFSKWFSETSGAREVPEKWLEFEKPAGE